MFVKCIEWWKTKLKYRATHQLSLTAVWGDPGAWAGCGDRDRDRDAQCHWHLYCPCHGTSLTVCRGENIWGEHSLGCNLHCRDHFFRWADMAAHNVWAYTISSWPCPVTFCRTELLPPRQPGDHVHRNAPGPLDQLLCLWGFRKPQQTNRLNPQVAVPCSAFPDGARHQSLTNFPVPFVALQRAVSDSAGHVPFQMNLEIQETFKWTELRAQSWKKPQAVCPVGRSLLCCCYELLLLTKCQQIKLP